MKKSEIGAAILSGRKLVTGTFQDWEIKEFEKRDKAGEYTVIGTCFVLVGREVVSVQTFADKGKRARDVARPAFKQGDAVCIEFRTWEQTKWGVRVAGEVTALLP